MFTSKLWIFIILGFGAVVIFLGMFRGETSIVKYYELKKSQRVLEDAISEIETESSELQLEIKKIRKSSSYARKVLREKYHVLDEGERIVFYGE